MPAPRVGLVFATLTVAFVVWLIVAVHAMQARPPVPDDGVGSPVAAGQDSVPARPPTGDTPAQLELAALKAQLRWEHRHYLAARRQARRLQARWRPTVEYAIRLAAAVSGVPAYELAAVARCESHLDPFATNGKYKGVFQLGWAPFGLDPFDPVANALSAAMTVRRDGGWRQWECKP